MVVQFSPEHFERKFNESLEKFDEFSNIHGMAEFCDFLISYRNNEKLQILSKLGDYRLCKKIDKSNIEIIKYAKKELKGFSISHPSKLLDVMFENVYSLIAFSCISELGRELNNNEFESILNTNLVSNLTIAQENFMSVNNINLDRAFFKELKKVRFNKQSIKLFKTIYYGYWKYICYEIGLETGPYFEIAAAANYLAGCYAFADGRVEAVPEDIIKGWTLTLNLFNMDLRPYVFK